VQAASLIPSRQYNMQVNCVTNCGLQVEIIIHRSPCNFHTHCRYSCAAPSAVIIVWVSMKCAHFLTDSTTMIVSCPCDSGSSTVKSTLATSQHPSGIGSGLSSPFGSRFCTFVHRFCDTHQCSGTFSATSSCRIQFQHFLPTCMSSNVGVVVLLNNLVAQAL
jgi:hypothetical protein